MKFLVDAQLPQRLAYRLIDAGHDTIHTINLPQSNRTPDAEIIAISLREQRVVITKDADFVDSFLLSRQPYKLPLISTGNITNAALEQLFMRNLHFIVEALQGFDYVELNRNTIIIHN